MICKESHTIQMSEELKFEEIKDIVLLHKD
jgi:hypothetical protein